MAKENAQAVPEPVWGELKTRVPVVQACSVWHQALRAQVPEHVRELGITAGWPQWRSAGYWTIRLSRVADDFTLVSVGLWPDGRWIVWLHDGSDLYESPAAKLDGQMPFDGDTQAGMEAAFRGLHTATDLIANHLTNAVSQGATE